LAPRVGEDTAEALMAEFPANEGDQLVTKQFLRAELAELRGEMAELRADLQTEMAALRTDMATLRSDLTLRLISVVAVATGIVVAFGR
jgi:hypothetical protein